MRDTSELEKRHQTNGALNCQNFRLPKASLCNPLSSVSIEMQKSMSPSMFSESFLALSMVDEDINGLRRDETRNGTNV